MTTIPASSRAFIPLPPFDLSISPKPRRHPFYLVLPGSQAPAVIWFSLVPSLPTAARYPRRFNSKKSFLHAERLAGDQRNIKLKRNLFFRQGLYLVPKLQLGNPLPGSSSFPSSHKRPCIHLHHSLLPHQQLPGTRILPVLRSAFATYPLRTGL